MMRQFTIQRAMFMILFALLFVMATRVPVDTDTWWHIRSGEHTLTEGMIYTDPFSHTMEGERWINHSWGAQVVMYGFWQVLGNAGLALFTALLATGGMYFLHRMSAGNIYLRAFVLVIGAATAAVFWSARPHMFSFFFSAVILDVLYRYKRDGVDRLWLLPPLMLVWGNLHAGFSIGFILLGGVIAGEILANIFNRDGEETIAVTGIRKLIIVSLVAAAALVINPYGLDMLRVPFETVSIGALRDFIQEWNSPDFHQRQTWPFIMLIVVLLGAVGGGQRRLGWTGWVLVSGTLFMALLAGRNIALFAVVATPIVTHHLDDILTRRGWVLRPMQRVSPRMARLNLILVGVILLGVLAHLLNILNPEFVAEAQAKYLPVAAVEYLNEEEPPGPMFNSYNWGGYLLFAAPDYPVFVDGRTDLYGDDLLLEYLDTAHGEPGWRDTLATYDINLVVVETGSGLELNLRDEPGWETLYTDDMATILGREDAS